MLSLTKRFLDIAVDGELARRQSPYHEQPSANTSVATAQPELTSNLDQSARGSFSWKAFGFVDLTEHGVRRLGDESSGKACHQAGSQVDECLHPAGSLAFIDALVNGFRYLFVNDEFGHGIRYSVEISFEER